MFYLIVSPLLGGQWFRSSAMASEVVLAFLGLVFSKMKSVDLAKLANLAAR